jgi:hypothetical protein
MPVRASRSRSMVWNSGKSWIEARSASRDLFRVRQLRHKQGDDHRLPELLPLDQVDDELDGEHAGVDVVGGDRRRDDGEAGARDHGAVELRTAAVGVDQREFVAAVSAAPADRAKVSTSPAGKIAQASIPSPRSSGMVMPGAERGVLVALEESDLAASGEQRGRRSARWSCRHRP